MGRIYILFWHNATGKQIVGASFSLDGLLASFGRDDRRPQEIVEVVFDVQTGKASQRTVAVTGGALAEYSRTGDSYRDNKRYRCIIGKHNRVRYRDRH